MIQDKLSKHILIADKSMAQVPNLEVQSPAYLESFFSGVTDDTAQGKGISVALPQTSASHIMVTYDLTLTGLTDSTNIFAIGRQLEYDPTSSWSSIRNGTTGATPLPINVSRNEDGTFIATCTGSFLVPSIDQNETTAQAAFVAIRANSSAGWMNGTIRVYDKELSVYQPTK